LSGAATGLAAEALHEVVDQDRHVVLALAQRREVDRQHVQPVHQVLAELAFRDDLGEVLVRGREDAHVDVHRLAAADRPELALLQEAQQLLLHVGAHVPDLVEEERPLVRHLQQPLAAGARAGEGAALVAEELALEQRVGQRRAVLGDEAALRARPFSWIARAISSLPVPLSAADVDREVAGDDAVEQPEDVHHRLAACPTMRE
jgi:hypothetical protein